MADNKVVIKINYDKKHANINAEPQTVTVWHIRRILIALAVLVAIVILLVSWLGKDSEHTSNDVESSQKVQNSAKADIETITTPLPIAENKPSVAAPLTQESVAQEPLKKADTRKKPTAIIFDRRVIRASLNGKPKDNEPGDPIKSPVRIIPTQSIETFYFSEIRNMKGKALFHQWSRNGQIVLQKQLDLKDKVSKVWSSKNLSAKDRGEWQIQLTDKKGKVYSEANFIVDVE